MSTESTLIVRKKLSPLLIADPDPNFIDELINDPSFQTQPPVLAQTGTEAQKIIAQFKKAFAGIFISPSIDDPHILQLIKSCHYYHPGVPIFLLDAPPNPKKPVQLGPQDLNDLGVQKILKKPIKLSELIKLVNPASVIFDPQEALVISQKNEDPLEKELEVQDIQFFPTRSETFLSGSRSFFDLYVRLDSGKYLKILKAGESFSSERIETYLQKGVQFFYLRKEAREHYVNFCDKIASAIVTSKTVSSRVKVGQTFRHGQETVDFLMSHGINKSSIEYANGFVNNVEQLVRSLNLKNGSLRVFFEDLSGYNHGVGTAFIAALLLPPLKILNEKAIQTLGVASLLHDIGLYNLPENIRNEDESKMSDSEKQLYRLHPITGAKTLESTKEVDPIVVQIVEQHHERKNRTGFPKQQGGANILLFSEIVGISDEFFRLILKEKDNPEIEPFTEIQKMYRDFSNPLVSAFQIAFPMAKKSDP